MAVAYVLAALSIIIFNIQEVPAAIALVVKSAFGVKAMAGGALGTMLAAMQSGIARGSFPMRRVLEVRRSRLLLPRQKSRCARVLFP